MNIYWALLHWLKLSHLGHDGFKPSFFKKITSIYSIQNVSNNILPIQKFMQVFSFWGDKSFKGKSNSGPHHEKTCLCNMRTTKAHPRSLISAFVVRCLDSIIPLVSISTISSLYQAFVAVQVGLSLPWSQILKTGFLVTRIKLSFIIISWKMIVNADYGFEVLYSTF